MTSQHDLFHDSIHDALGADIAAIGGMKKVAGILWPAKDDGAARLRACLSIEHQQKLDAEEMLSIKALAHAVGSHATVNYEAQTLGYRVEWLEPEDERAALQRELVDALRTVGRLGQRLELRLGLKAVG